MTERAKKLLLLYCKQGGKIRRVSGLPLLTFKAKKAGTLNNYRIYGNTETKTRSYSGSAPLSFPIEDGSVSNYRIYGNTVNGESVGDLVTDSQSEHYGEYAIPITNNNEIANIYLPEQIKMVGDETEYIDYAEQKQHRVRKNLLQNTATSRTTTNGVTFMVNSDGSIVCDGQTSSSTATLIFSNFLVPSGTYILTGCPNGGSERRTYKMLLFINGAWFANDMGSGANFTLTETSTVSVRIDIYNGYTCDNLTFYPMIRKADIEDDTYEPYIENTEVDVILPGIAVTAGTNTLTVGTEVQPSSVAVDVDEVVSCGDRTGNLFDLNTWANTIRNINGNGLMSISGNTISITSVNSTDCFTMPYVDSQIGVYKIPVKPNTIYTVNWYGSKYRILLFKNGTLDRIYTYDTSDGLRSFTTDSDATFITIRFGVKPTNPVGTTATISDFMISEGSTALPYEPYGYRVPVTTERSVPHTATLQLHDCLPSNMQFDATEALYYAENGLPAGTYNFTIQNSYETSFGGGKTYQFTLANDVPAKGQLVFGWDYDTLASDAKITSYASSTSTTAIEQVGVTEGSGGTSLGTTDGNSTNVNHIHRARYGSNNYKESAIRQFLNSSAAAGSVWTPQTKYDRPPSWNSNTAGFMKDIDSDFLAVLGASPKVVALNTVTDGGGSVTINNDKFFLLSCSEVYGGEENNINEGEPYPYYSNYSDLSAAGRGDDSNRTKYRSGTAQFWWLRSPYSGYGGNVRYVGNYGGVPTGYFANNSDDGVAPACNIALDEDYKFNGQVLHVRDQISVQKGNQTLVFDVIGIDHDEVHFDKTTTNIYLPHQIKMVGDEAEYVDYAEQKWHRVRKNLLPNTVISQKINGITFTVNEDGSVTCNGTATDVAEQRLNTGFSLPAGNYRLTGIPFGGNASTYYLRAWYFSSGSVVWINDYGKGRNFTLTDTTKMYSSIVVWSGKVLNNITFYPMIRKADIEDDTYEPYIENTEVDVTLPEIAVTAGTNVLSVGTEAQPSDIYLKGKIKKKPKIYYKIYYYSQDGQTALSTETVEEGHDCTYSTVPTKESDTDFNYTFTGWSTTTNSTTATAGATENIQQNTNLYAAFSKSFKTDTISDSWEEIIANCDNGTYASKYQIGDLKTIDVGTEGPVQMQIVAIDTDLLASDNTKKAPITWISKQLLNTDKVMNDTSTNYLSDWTNCDMRTYLKNTVLPMLPSVVQNNIKEVTKYTNQRTGSTTFTTISSTEDIWLPSYREISNNTSNCETSGVQYNSIFTDNESRVKSKVGNSAHYWWTRSASGYSSSACSYCFAIVYNDGTAAYAGYSCATSHGAAIGFCT